jgi:hypothetical protein
MIRKDLTSELHRWTQVASDAAMTFRKRWTDLALRVERLIDTGGGHDQN